LVGKYSQAALAKTGILDYISGLITTSQAIAKSAKPSELECVANSQIKKPVVSEKSNNLDKITQNIF
jgi:hypothetical protein